MLIELTHVQILIGICASAFLGAGTVKWYEWLRHRGRVYCAFGSDVSIRAEVRGTPGAVLIAAVVTTINQLVTASVGVLKAMADNNPAFTTALYATQLVEVTNKYNKLNKQIASNATTEQEALLKKLDEFTRQATDNVAVYRVELQQLTTTVTTAIAPRFVRSDYCCVCGAQRDEKHPDGKRTELRRNEGNFMLTNGLSLPVVYTCAPATSSCTQALLRAQVAMEQKQKAQAKLAQTATAKTPKAAPVAT